MLKTKRLNNSDAVFTVQEGYLCRVNNGMLNYDYPFNETLLVKHANVYDQLQGLKTQYNLLQNLDCNCPGLADWVN